MSSVNKVIIIGNLGRDPEVRFMQSGDRVVTLAVATSERWTDKQSGDRREKTEWHRVVIFDQNIVDIAEKYLKKGSKAFFEGKLQTRKWTDNAGTDRYTTEIVLPRFGGLLTLLSSPRDGEGPTGGGGAQTTAAETVGGGGSTDPMDLDDDIPF